MGTVGGNEPHVATLLLSDGDTPSPPAPQVAVQSSALTRRRGAFLMFDVLHFIAVKKPRHDRKLARSDRASMNEASVTVGPTAQRVGGTYGGRRQSRWLP